jgi:hypothetical protein
MARYDRFRRKAAFFSPIRPFAAISKSAKTQVASCACLGSLARDCGMFSAWLTRFQPVRIS